MEHAMDSELLLAARNADINSMQSLLNRAKYKEITLDINCKGTKKANRGWAPLHLAAYFGHVEAVKVLLENGADIDVLNDVGDTPLHKAAYTGRQDIVMVLLDHGCDVHLINSEGNTAKKVARTREIRDLIEATENTEKREAEEKFLKAAMNGDISTLTRLLQSRRPPNINCTDVFGNSALHLAAQNGKTEIVVLLLQNGIASFARNKRDQTADEVTKDVQMKRLLDVRSVRRQRLNRHEGPLFRKVRLLGWRPVWAVLNQGVLTLFPKREDASSDQKKKLIKCLNDARVQMKADSTHIFTMTLPDRSVMTFSVCRDDRALTSRHRWVTSLEEHIAYMNQLGGFAAGGLVIDDGRDEILPLVSIQDAFKIAQTQRTLLQKQIASTTQNLGVLSDGGNAGTSKQMTDALAVRHQLTEILDSSKEMLQNLSQCLDLFIQQDELRRKQLDDEMEKSRVLQDSLHILAKEHLLLEKSITINPLLSTSPINQTGRLYRAPSIVSNSEEFYDCADEDDAGEDEECEDVDETGNDFCNGAMNVDDVLHERDQSDDEQLQRISTRDTNSSNIDSDMGLSIFGGRCRLPVSMHSRTFSVWSILKQCIGRELSKITMPVVFNEPLSFLQRMVEYLEYVTLLKKASDSEDPIQRLELVTAFAVSALASNWERIGKPFNPLLGETYHLDRSDLGFRVVCEQVSHHPPVSAFHADSPLFTFHGAIEPKIKFWGKSVEVTPKGIVTLHLLRHNEMYTWQNVNCFVHNIIVGKIWIEHSGTMEVTNHTTQYKSVLNFKTAGWFGKDLHAIEGFIYDEKKQKRKAIYGNWIEALYSCDVAAWQDRETISVSRGDTISRVKQGSNVEQNKSLTRTSATNLPAIDALTENDVVRNGETHIPNNGPEGTEAQTSNDVLASAVVDVVPTSFSFADPESTDSVPAHLLSYDNTTATDMMAYDSEKHDISTTCSTMTSDSTVDHIQDGYQELYPVITCDLHLPNQSLLWTSSPKPQNSREFYNFTLFAMMLNELDKNTQQLLPRTDSRLRPDMRFMENGDLDGAACEKNRLEEKQRDARKVRGGDSAWKPMWFERKKNVLSGQQDFLFTNDYWKCAWENCPDIF